MYPVPRALPSRRHFLLIATLLGVLLALSLTAGTAECRVAKGIVIVPSQAEALDGAHVRSLAREIGGALGSRWVRLQAPWAELEPEQGHYSVEAFASLDGLVTAFHSTGLRVMLTVSATPAWASDRSLWARPPRGYAEGPQPFHPPSADALPSFADLGETLARRYAGTVQAIEVWNEPNLWMFLYPQRSQSDPLYGAHAYLRMLKAFSRGMRRVPTGIRIVAGATGPVGLNDVYRTSPQRFARALKRAGAGRYFDGYSHHPYTPGGTIYQAPDQPPNDPSTTVTLYNLRTLLKLFPTKPFYLTEYGYSTRPSLIFGLSVTERQQARYLTDAFRIASRHPQVKMLAWYLLRDQVPPSGDELAGVYTGLRRKDGSRKPAWYAFRHIGR